MTTKTKKTAGKRFLSSGKVRAPRGVRDKSSFPPLFTIFVAANLLVGVVTLLLVSRILFSSGISLLPPSIAREAKTGLPIPEAVQAFSEDSGDGGGSGAVSVTDGGGVWIRESEGAGAGSSAGGAKDLEAPKSKPRSEGKTKE